MTFVLIYLIKEKKSITKIPIKEYAYKVYRLLFSITVYVVYPIFHEIYVRNPGTLDVEIYLLILVLIFIFVHTYKSLRHTSG